MRGEKGRYINIAMDRALQDRLRGYIKKEYPTVNHGAISMIVCKATSQFLDREEGTATDVTTSLSSTTTTKSTGGGKGKK